MPHDDCDCNDIPSTITICPAELFPATVSFEHETDGQHVLEVFAGDAIIFDGGFFTFQGSPVAEVRVDKPGLGR